MGQSGQKYQFGCNKSPPGPSPQVGNPLFKRMKKMSLNGSVFGVKTLFALVSF
jgi:hypothetical protein